MRCRKSAVSKLAFGGRGPLGWRGAGTETARGLGLGATRSGSIPAFASTGADARTCLITRFLEHLRHNEALRSGEKKVALHAEQVRRNFIPLIGFT